MSVARVLSRAQLGLDAPLVYIEAHLGAGLPGFSLVGLPAPVVRESRERVRSAIVNAGFDFPSGRITVNLAPVELSKEGGRYDLPIALALLLASGQLRASGRAPVECFGELGLGGELRPVRGLLLAAIRAAQCGHDMLVPHEDLPEVRLTRYSRVYGFATLAEVCKALASGQLGGPLQRNPAPPVSDHIVPIEKQYNSLDEVKGQWRAKRALTIAAAGGHSLLMVGPPGSGKSMLASRLPGLLPPLTDEEALAVAGIASLSRQGFDPICWRQRPFRSPHHAASANAIVGGGSRLRAGEISLAHHGVLFMDELPEFDRRVLEALREPLESGAITLARASDRLSLPAEFQLVAAMNPCPCGYLGDDSRVCRCSARRIRQYRDRISGPLLDRIDLYLEVPRVELSALQATLPEDVANAEVAAPGSLAVQLRASVCEARSLQQRRQQCCNARLDHAGIESRCQTDVRTRRILEQVGEHFRLSARGYHRLLKVSRTIADLAGGGPICPAHVSEAASLRLATDSSTP